jgi:hypothetical protein
MYYRTTSGQPDEITISHTFRISSPKPSTDSGLKHTKQKREKKTKTK